MRTNFGGVHVLVAAAIQGPIGPLADNPPKPGPRPSTPTCWA